MKQDRVMHKVAVLVLFLGALVVVAGLSRAADADDYPYMNEYPLPSGAGAPEDIVAASPGHVWFTLPETDQVGELFVTDPDNYDFELYQLPEGSAPKAIAFTDDAAWVSAPGRNQLLRIDSVTGVLSEWTLPQENSQPAGITVGPSGDLWIAATGSNQVLRFEPSSGDFTEYDYTRDNAGVTDIAVLDDETTVYFTAENLDMIVRLTPWRYPDFAFTIAPLIDTNLNSVGRPGQVAVNSAGHLWVVAAERPLLGLSTLGTFSYWSWEEVAPAGIEPHGLALSTMGSTNLVWYTLPEAGSVGVQGRSAEGRFFMHVHTIPAPGSEPSSIAVDGANHGWIAVAGSNRIAEWLPPYNDTVSLPMIFKHP